MDARPDYFTEDNQGNQEPLVFLLSKAKKSLPGNLVRADKSRFVSFATFPVLRSFSEGGCKIVF
jgi:hypothetical protein